MERKTKINDNIYVLEHEYNDAQNTVVVDEEYKRVNLLSSNKTNTHILSKMVCNNDYIVTYTYGYLASQIPVNITGAYDIKRRSVMSLDDEKKELLSEIFVYGKSFDTKIILSIINMNNIQFVDSEKIAEFIDYITNGNDRITSYDIIDYIYAIYPELQLYTNINEDLSDFDFNETLKRIGQTLWFSKMPICMDYKLEDENKLSR